MSIQITNRAQAFMPGSDLWIIPDENDHELIKKINWYLNFQLTRSQQHSPLDLPLELKNIMNENQIPLMIIANRASLPLYVRACDHLPAQSVVKLPESDDSASWITKIHKIWSGLKNPSLRVFLPRNITTEELKSLWPSHSATDLTIVELKV